MGPAAIRPGARTEASFESIAVCGSADRDLPILLEQAHTLLEAAAPRAVQLIQLAEPTHSDARLPTGWEAPSAATLARLGLAGRHSLVAASAATIVDDVRQAGADLVIKGVVLHEAGKGVLDAVDLELIRRCPCPVWLADRASPTAPRRVVAALPRDGDLAVRTAAVAARFAEAVGAELEVFHAWQAQAPLFGSIGRQARGQEGTAGADQDRALRAVQDVLVAAGVSLNARQIHLAEGRFVHAMPRFLALDRVDAVVMGTRGRIGWLDSVVRPHAETVLSEMAVPVLVVKADSEA